MNLEQETIGWRLGAFKAWVYALRALVVLERSKFPVAYPELFLLAGKLELGEFGPLMRQAKKWRKVRPGVDGVFAYRNVSFLNMQIMPMIKSFMKSVEMY